MKKTNLLEDDVALVEEQQKANENYNKLYNTLQEYKAAIPYPDVKLSDREYDYDLREDLEYKKRRNGKIWDKIDVLKPYYDEGSLYVGHLVCNEKEYFFMDAPHLATRMGEPDILLINTDDKHYTTLINKWRYPAKGKDVLVSRNVRMKNKEVYSVDVIYDKNSQIYSQITDKYLIETLKRNKNNPTMQGLIQTINQKQNVIRELPWQESFILQGCAGSGKTMVLLYRLRYLKHNEELNNYILLVPGDNFKAFVDENAKAFALNVDNISTITNYYRSFQGMRKYDDKEILDEAAFSLNYLQYVYDKNFIRDIYRTLFDKINFQAEKVINLCEKKLGEIIQQKKEEEKLKIEQKENEVILKIKQITFNVRQYTKQKELDSWEDVVCWQEEVKKQYSLRKEEIAKYKNNSDIIEIKDDDERILNDKEIMKARVRLEKAQEELANAIILTRHRRKERVETRRREYEELHALIKNRVVEAEKLKQQEQVSKLNCVYDDITFDVIDNILSTIDTLKLDVEQYKEEHIKYLTDEYYEEKYSDFTELMDESFDKMDAYDLECQNYIEELKPGYDFIIDKIKVIATMLDKLKDITILSKVEQDEIDNNAKVIKGVNVRNQSSYINRLLFSICRRYVKNKFSIDLSSQYKHYWYLYTYCKYLSGRHDNQQYKQIFIDEAQDLSISEIELIQKLNISNTGERPIFNIFGDVRQMITKHGIGNWHSVNAIETFYELDENFRNPNQIIDYCNKNLSLNMEKVGVDMDEVFTYDNVKCAIGLGKLNMAEYICLVKGEDEREMLYNELENNSVKNTIVYTVKEAKGLEFSKVAVFDSGMTDNEKYVAYTRALSKLVVVRSRLSDGPRESRIVQGSSQDDNFD